MARISALVITKNAEQYLPDCLEGLLWADEIVVLDSTSTDHTTKVASRYTQKIFQHDFVSFPKTRNLAIDMAQGDWVFFLDADERTTPKLVTEIEEVVQAKDIPYIGYWIPRRNLILGKWMQHTGWYPDYQMRLFRRTKGRYDIHISPHEIVVLQGSAGFLSQPITHHNYESMSQLLSKQGFYSSHEAREWHQRGIRAKPQNFILQPLREFQRRYFIWEGYKDGLHGFFLSLFMAYYNFLTYIKLSRLS